VVSLLPQNERITIGKILKPKGLRGEVKILPLSDIPERFQHLKAVCVRQPDGQEVTLSIVDVRPYKGFVYLRFSERSSRESVMDLIDGEILVDSATAPELPDGVYYHFEILDSEVYTDEGQRLGVVVDILETGAHDVYVVQEEQREYLIPVTDDIVRQIDRTQKRITIHPLEGLLDL
jgi:16S rRNA processing protein RimM